MNEKILIVDDDPGILSAFERQLRKNFDVDTAVGGEPGLDAVADKGPYAVVISDMKMPGMDGIRFLSKVKEVAPDTVRMMLTGCTDQNIAIKAVNEGAIFRFITKPCQPDILANSLVAGVQQHQLITAERELLENTLSGSIALLTEIISILDPDMFGRAMKLKDLVHTLAQKLNVDNFWEVEAAAMLSQIGYVTIPPEIVVKVRKGETLPKEEQKMLALVPEFGAHLLENIPRLIPVSKIVYYQNKRFDGSGFPQDSVKERGIPVGARILKILWDLVQMESAGTPRIKAFEIMRNRKGWYDLGILEKIFGILGECEGDVVSEGPPSISVSVSDLGPGHILSADLKTLDGLLLLSAGQRISLVALERLRNYSKLIGIKEPVYIESLLPEKVS